MPESRDARQAAPDRITVSVVQHRLTAIVAEMGEAMLRTAYSQILNSSRDFSTALCDADGRLLAQAEHVPIHVGALPWSVRSVLDFFRGRIRPGDLYLVNDPYHGGSHLPDVTVVLPVFASTPAGGGHASADERLLCWTVNRAHQSDIGGATHGSYNAAATEIWQEGLRIPPLKLYDAGVERDDVLTMVAINVRHSRDFLGDLRASMGSARLGERRILHLADEYGMDLLVDALREVLDGTERRTRACIRPWRDGVYRGEAVLDDDGHGATDIAVRATVTKRGDALTVDLRRSDPQVTGFVNSALPNTMSAVHMAIAYLIDADIPKNDGTFRPVRVLTREGTIVHPRPPAPVTLSTNHCGQEIAESVIKALAPACPDRAVAGWGRRFRIALRGTDPRSGRPFIWHMFHARPGGGASPVGDGWPTAGEGQAAGGLKFGSVEVTEVRFPLLMERHEFRPDSGGEGQFRGGVGAQLIMRVQISEPAVANTAGDGVRHAPYGLFGGREGAVHRYRLVSRGRSRVLRTKEVGIPVHGGDVFLIESSGGGGYGPPPRRAAAARAADLADGFVTRRAPRSRPKRRSRGRATPARRAAARHRA
ncbi:MAG TPA: hydantoinase B/oxoprolinase family protein [bacterium]|nr:hydantoinase B/oxoprolinase family protein [bacterium]